MSLLDDYDDASFDNSQNANETETFTDTLETPPGCEEIFIAKKLEQPINKELSDANDFVEIEIYVEDQDSTKFNVKDENSIELKVTTDENAYTGISSYVDLDENYNEMKNVLHIEKQKIDQPIDLCVRNTDKTSMTIETSTPNQHEDITETQQTINENNVRDDSTHTESSDNRSRSRFKNPDSWKKNIRKHRRQSGLEYISSRGTPMAEKSTRITKDCKGKCRFSCAWSFSNADMNEIHSDFWSLDDESKMVFYAGTTERILKGKKRKRSSNTDGDNEPQADNTMERDTSKRIYSFRYYLKKNSENIRVCQDFYKGVLGINISRVRTYYDKLDNKSDLRDMRGRKTKAKLPERDTDFVRYHINSFNTVASHYCRNNSSKKYLESTLTVSKMYDLYKEECAKRDYSPLKISKYRHIFNKDFNLSFHIPKKDRCDMCEEIKMRAENNIIVDDETRTKYDKHKSDKVDTKTERDADRGLVDTTTAIFCFDLENVIALPRADISNFFYKRKLNTYNLTCHCSIGKAVYNAVWTEADAGRGGNEIACALVAILHEFSQTNPEIKNYIIWSDACVPQNRNSIMTFALKTFLTSHDVHIITQKFGCPGHSSIQEVDNAHSCIEKALKVSEVFSPVSLVRVLKSVGTRRKGPFIVIQMRHSHFYDFQKVTNTLKFGSVPYTKVKCLKYSKDNQMGISFKLSFTEHEFTSGVIMNGTSTRNAKPCRCLPIPEKFPVHKKPTINILKKKDITSMLKYMGAVDSQYYIARNLIVQTACDQTTAKKQKT